MLVSSTSMKAANETTNAISHGFALGFHTCPGNEGDDIALFNFTKRSISFRLLYYTGRGPMLKPDALRSPGSSKLSLGRPRSEKTRKAILKAAFRLLKAHGLDDVSSQQIAKEAGVSTATLYRWWKDKEAIMLDAYLATTRELLPYGVRGSALCRLRRYTIRIAEFLRSDDGRAFLRLMLAIQDRPALRKAFYETVFLPRRSEGCLVVREAIAAGELPASVDPDEFINMVLGPQILPALMGRSLSMEAAGKIFDFVLRAATA